MFGNFTLTINAAKGGPGLFSFIIGTLSMDNLAWIPFPRKPYSIHNSMLLHYDETIDYEANSSINKGSDLVIHYSGYFQMPK